MKLIIIVALTFSINALSQGVNFQWANSIGGTSNDGGQSVVIGSEGESYTVGTYGGTMDIDPGVGVENVSSNGSSDIFILKLDESGNYIWGKSIGGASQDFPSRCSIDSNGNLLISGNFEGTMDADPNATVFEVESNGDRDVFILKLDSDGNFLWCKTFGGTIADINYDLHLDESDNIYLTGSYHNTVDFDTGDGTYELTSSGGEEVYILKLDESGDFILAKSFGGTSTDRGYGITVDELENIYVTGSFRSTADLDPDETEFLVTSTGTSDIFILKLDPNGQFKWGNALGGVSSDIGSNIAINSTGELFFTGTFFNDVDFDPTDDEDIITSLGSLDGFLQKLDTAGNYFWTKRIGGAGQDEPNTLFIDESDNIFLSGLFSNSVDFDFGEDEYVLSAAGAEDLFLEKLDLEGQFIWCIGLGANLADIPRSVDITSEGTILVTGDYAGPTDFNPGVGTYNLTSAGGRDGFVVKLTEINIANFAYEYGSENNNFLIFPNPAPSSFVTIRNQENENILSLRIYSSNGDLLHEVTDLNTIEYHLYYDTPPGLYLIEITTAKSQSISKWSHY